MGRHARDDGRPGGQGVDGSRVALLAGRPRGHLDDGSIGVRKCCGAVDMGAPGRELAGPPSHLGCGIDERRDNVFVA